MNLWIPVIFSITLMQSFESKRDKERGTLIRKELDMLKKKLESSKNWKSKYERDLRLYTAKIDEYTDTCTQTIFDCYCEEFKVVVEEISMTEEENVAKGIRHTLNNMLTYRPSESDMIVMYAAGSSEESSDGAPGHLRFPCGIHQSAPIYSSFLGVPADFD
ncbi:interleukin-15 isoform X1 [Bufo bufo]|uniref:interleukin-15 isoform X1 n=1 Tax=Bufo bufo TaxID=8384 RepID=UPI001ABEE0FE|nr:interleukin-15 isoform X1 [Bufo bufo]